MPRDTRNQDCQLCDGHRVAAPKAVVVIANIRLCEKHQRLLQAIAKDASGTKARRRRHPVNRSSSRGMLRAAL